MGSKRLAKKILKMYGKELFNARVSYMDGSLEKSESTGYKGRTKFVCRRSIAAICTIALVISLGIISASGQGINLFKMEKTVYSDNDEYRYDETLEQTIDSISKANVGEINTSFLEPEYIPEGFELAETNTFMDMSVMHIYVNQSEEEKKILSIDMTQVDNFTLNINNEHCQVMEKIIDEKQVVIYDYDDEADGKIYLMQEGKIIVQIAGTVSDEEFEKIIFGLSPIE